MERSRATEQLIAWAKSDETLVTDNLKEAFEAFYKAGGVYNRRDEQGILEWRRNTLRAYRHRIHPCHHQDTAHQGGEGRTADSG